MTIVSVFGVGVMLAFNVQRPPPPPPIPPPVAVEEAVPVEARLTSLKTVDALPYFNPALALKGTMQPAAGRQLLIVEIAIGATPFLTDVAGFALTIAGGAADYMPIAAGGGANLTFPFDRIPVGHEVGQILPSDAIVAVKRQTATSVTIEAGPLATLAFVYDVPQGAAARSLKLPDGTFLSLDKKP